MTWERAVAENAWQLEEGLYRVLLPLPFGVPFVNVFLVESRSEYLLVDCGANWLPSLRALGRALKAIGVPARGLTYLVLTHSHPDHADAAGPVQERWGGRVLMHPAEGPRPTGAPPDLLAWMEENGVDEEILAKARAPRRERPSAPAPTTEPLATDRPLILGDLSFEVILVPGHSPGQVMLREPSRGWLFTADHVLPYQAGNVWVFPGADGDPFGEYLASLTQTLDLEASFTLPAHGLPVREGPRAMTQGLLDYHYRLADRVRALLRDRPLKAWEIVKLLGEDVPADPQGARFSLAEALAVLTYLAKRGEVRRLNGGAWKSE